MFEQPLYNFDNVIHEEWAQNTIKLPLSSTTAETSATVSTTTVTSLATTSFSRTSQLPFGGGEFVGIFDRDALPVGGSSFIAWRCHGMDLAAASTGGGGGGGSLRSLTPSTIMTTVIDLVEIPFTPTNMKDQGHFDIGVPNKKNGGALRLVLPQEAGVVTGTTSMHMTHSDGKILLCIATSAGYFYRVEFKHHPSDVEHLEEISRLRSSFSRSEPVVYPPQRLGGFQQQQQQQQAVVTVGQAQWVDAHTVLISNMVPPGPAAVVVLGSGGELDMTPLASEPETGTVSQLISWISGQGSSTTLRRAVPSSTARNADTPLEAWEETRALCPDVYHVTGTMIDTGVGKASILVRGGDSSDSSSGSSNIRSGLELWVMVNTSEGVSQWVCMCTMDGSDLGPAFLQSVAADADVTNSSNDNRNITSSSSNNSNSMHIAACAYGKEKCTIGIVLAFNEYGHGGHQGDARTCSTRVLRLEGTLDAATNNANGMSSATLSLLLPVDDEEAEGEGEEDVVDNDGVVVGVRARSDIDGLHFDEQCPFERSRTTSTRVVELHVNITDMNEDALDEDAVPTLTLLLETTQETMNSVNIVEKTSSTLLVHRDRYDDTSIAPRIEQTLQTTQARSIAERNQSRIDFCLFESLDDDEGDESEQDGADGADGTADFDGTGASSSLSADDIEEHFLRRVTMPGRYSTTTLLFAVKEMLTSSNTGLPNGGRKMVGSSPQDVKILISRAVAQGADQISKKDERRRQRQYMQMNGGGGNNGGNNDDDDDVNMTMTPQLRAWRQFLTCCAEKELLGRTSVGLIQSICLKYDHVEEMCYVTGKHVVGVVRESTISLLRPPTPLESLCARMDTLTHVRMTPFSMSPVDEVLVSSGLLMADAANTEEGKDLLFQLLNGFPLDALDHPGSSNGSRNQNDAHFGRRAESLLEELCGVLDRARTKQDDYGNIFESKTTESHSVLTTHVRRFGSRGFRDIIVNVLSATVPMRSNGGNEYSSDSTSSSSASSSPCTRQRRPNDDAPRITAAAAAYSATTLRDVVSCGCRLSVAVALCLKMTLRRCVHGTGSAGRGAGSVTPSVDPALRMDLSSMLRHVLLRGVLLRAMVLRDLGDCLILARRPSVDRERSNDGRMTTSRMKRLQFEVGAQHLDSATSHGGAGFLQLMRHNASAGATVEDSEAWSVETDGPLDMHMSMWSTSTTVNVEGRSVLEVLLLYYADVVPMLGSEDTMRTAGGGRSIAPTQWFHDVSVAWTDATAVVDRMSSGMEIPLSMAHVVGFLMSRGQIETLARVCAGMLSSSGGGSCGGNGSSTSRVVSTNADLANLRVLGECWLTTSTHHDVEKGNSRAASTVKGGPMELAFRYMLRACPAKQIDLVDADSFSFRNDDDDDENMPHMDLEEETKDDNSANSSTTNATAASLIRASRRDRIRYLMTMMHSFVSVRRSRTAVLCARAAIASIGTPLDNEEYRLLSSLWRSVFTQCVNLEEFDAAWLAIGSNPNPSSRSFCVQQLVSAMYDAHALDVLLRLPLVHGVRSNLLELEKALETKASFTPLHFSQGQNSTTTEFVTVHHYLYAIHIKHNNYRKAAECMFNLAKACVAQGMTSERTIRTKRAAIDMCTDALATAASTLRLLPSEDERYILDTKSTNDPQSVYFHNELSSEKNNEDIDEKQLLALTTVWLEDIQCKIIQNRCRLALLERHERQLYDLQRHQQQQKQQKRREEQQGNRAADRKKKRDHRSMHNNNNNNGGENSTTSPSLSFSDEKTISENLLATPRQLTMHLLQATSTTQQPTLKEYELCIDAAFLHTADHHRPDNQTTPTNDVRLTWLRPVVTKMSSHLVSLRISGSSASSTSTTRSTYSLSIRLEELLKSVLQRLDGVECGHGLHVAAASAMLSEDDAFGLPTWLVRSFEGGVGSLRYGRSLPLDNASTRTYLPLSKYLPSFSNSVRYLFSASLSIQWFSN